MDLVFAESLGWQIILFQPKKTSRSEIKGSDSLRSPELGRRETDHVTNFFSLRSGCIACKGSSEKD